MKIKILSILTIILVAIPLINVSAIDYGDYLDPSDLNLNIEDLLFGDDSSSASNVSVNKFDLFWYTDTYTPFSYTGRALPIIGSKIIIDAVVSVSNGDAKALKYSWFLEDIFQQNKSGYGKNSFYFYAQQRSGAYHTVRLQIFNEDRTIFLEKSIQIPIANPELIIYPNNGNPYFLNQADDNPFVVSGQEFSLLARPYFFSINKITDLRFEWTIGAQQPIISSNYNANILDLNITDKNSDGLSQQSLQINVENLKAKEQNVYQSILINIF